MLSNGIVMGGSRNADMQKKYEYKYIVRKKKLVRKCVCGVVRFVTGWWIVARPGSEVCLHSTAARIRAPDME